MVKVKNKKNSGLANKVHHKKKADAHKKKINPFEVHINREKIKVLGQKSKHDRGLPGVSRAKAIQRRKETLGTEMKLMNKTNAFIDRRIGEKDNQLSAEDKIIARFAAERAKQHDKKNIYNLADDEILTHRGQTLEQIEKFDDPRSSDDEEEDGRKFGGLGDEFVSEGHFGGGVLSNTEKEGVKSHKDLIEQLIAESKKRKAEKQKEKEQTLDLTEKLDNEWKDLQPVIVKRARVEEVKEKEKVQNKTEKSNQEYDKMMRELRFEMRGTPSDGLKNEEQKAKEEKEKLLQMERERERRMMGDEETQVDLPKNTTANHRSVEDLDGNYELDNEQDFMLAYDNEGKPLVPDEIFKANSVPNSKKQFQDGVSDTSSEDGEEESDDDDDDDGETDEESEDKTQKAATKVNKQSIEDESIKIPDDGEENDDGSDDDDENDDGVDGDEEGSDESGDESEDEKKIDLNDLTDLRESDVSDDEELTVDDGDTIKSFFEKSDEGDKLKELLTGKTPSQQSHALEKLIKSYDPSLSVNNKDLLTKLFAHLLQYINDIFTNLTEESEVIKSFLIFNKIAPHLFGLAQTNKVSIKKLIAEVLKEKYGVFKKNPRKIPDLDTLVFFKLISLIYPTSDFSHPITTPAMVFMSEILNLGRFRDVYSISRGLFVSALILEYTSLSKRFVPSLVNFLRGMLYLSSNTSILNPIKLVPPFKVHKDVKSLILEDDCSKMAVGTKMAAKDLILESFSNEFKIRCLNTTVGMLREVFDYFNDLEAQECIFECHVKLLGRIEGENYPKKVGDLVRDTLKYMRDSLEVKTYTPLTREKKKVKLLRLYEPDVQEVFTGGKNFKKSKEKIASDKLQHKYKKEMKGALREIRRDKAYIGSVKIRQKIQSDNIRKEKVKQIYKDASIQQGELNKLKRMK